MLLSDFSVKKPVAMVVIIIGLMALGLLALSKLRVNQIPDVEQPVLVVNVPYPGASPETVEREVVNRIEKALQGIAGVDEVRATASEGNAQIVLIFDFDKDLIVAADGLNSALRRELSPQFGPRTDWLRNKFAWYGTPRPFDIPWIVLDHAKATRVWGWRPQRTTAQVLEEIARHAEAHPQWLDLSAPL